MEPKHYWPLQAGLSLAILGNVLLASWFIVDPDIDVLPIGNVTVVIVCSGVMWLIRSRRRGRI